MSDNSFPPDARGMIAASGGVWDEGSATPSRTSAVQAVPRYLLNKERFLLSKCLRMSDTAVEA